MTTTIKASADGLSAVIQINGVDKATIDSTGKITAASFAGNGAALTGLPSSVSSVVGQTGAVTAAQVLTALLAVDGSGSGLDADTLDGYHASSFALASHAHLYGNSANVGDLAIGTWGPGNGVPGYLIGRNLTLYSTQPYSCILQLTGTPWGAMTVSVAAYAGSPAYGGTWKCIGAGHTSDSTSQVWPVLLQRIA